MIDLDLLIPKDKLNNYYYSTSICVILQNDGLYVCMHASCMCMLKLLTHIVLLDSAVRWYWAQQINEPAINVVIQEECTCQLYIVLYRAHGLSGDSNAFRNSILACIVSYVTCFLVVSISNVLENQHLLTRTVWEESKTWTTWQIEWDGAKYLYIA